LSNKIDSYRLGQEPIGTRSLALLSFLTVLWAFNSVAIKIIVKDVAPFYAALLRFAPSVILIGIFLRIRGIGIRVTIKQFLLISLVGLLMGFQIFTFNIGSMYTTGGRVTLFLFSYPFYVALLAPLFVKEERLSPRIIAGSILAIAGLVVALSSRLNGGSIAGDLIELASGIILALQVSVNKMVIRYVDKWKITFWQFVVASIVFLIGALFSEKLDVVKMSAEAWWALGFQIVVISVAGILLWQYLLAKHSAAKVSIFFFITPIAGTFITMIALGEAFDPGLLAGALLVGSGIVIAYREKPYRANSKRT
jgi:drug/metabolite transporter (DMT)-like permease